MLSAFVLRPQGLVRTEAPFASDGSAAPEALWFDLLEPTVEEERAVERALGIDVPTREEMREIESSNRLYEENGALFLTATIVTKLDTDLPESTQVTFILAGGKLVTNRYTDPLPFRRFISYAQTHPAPCQSGVLILVGLLEAIVNRIADVLERVGSDLDSISAEVFTPPRRSRRRASGDFREVLGRVGQTGELVSKARESLVSLGRLLAFVQQTTSGPDHAGCARALSHRVARRARDERPRLVSRRQGVVRARCHARHADHRSEQHPEDLLGGHGVPAAAFGGRRLLRHELRRAAGGARAMGSLGRSRPDGAVGVAALPAVQAPPLALIFDCRR